MGVDLSLVIPALNEAERIPPYLRSIRAYFAGPSPSYELIVVDDGSDDGTGSVVEAAARDWPELRLIRHDRNHGKGAALRTGVMASSGRLVLLADADGASAIGNERGLREAIERGAEIAVGSRYVDGHALPVRRSWHRDLCGRVFAWVVRTSLALPVRDSQCGFKMLRRGAALELLGRCQEKGYLLDVELLALARLHGHTITEVAISWTDVPGSKVRLVRDSWKMFRGLGRIRAAVRRQGVPGRGNGPTRRAFPTAVRPELPDQAEALREAPVVGGSRDHGV